MRYDLDLFLALNEEYRSKPIVPQPRSLEGSSLLATSQKRAADLDKKLGGITSKRVLEVGCGRGHFSRVLADDYGCQVSGVDIRDYPEWTERPDLSLHKHDIATLQNDFLGKFDFIVSYAVWEHVEHPYAALQATRDLLNADGKMYLYANLYRGPMASHRYREIFFPWPHLLFTDEVVESFYVTLGKPPTRPAWVNKLTYAQYMLYFEQLGFDVERAWVSQKPLDEDFYHRFEDVLGRYPRFDLVRDFIYAIVSPRPTTVEDHEALRAKLQRVQRQRDRLARELKELQGSRSWRYTEPLRAVRRLRG
jgi:SAM-dependent methyltransferase